MSRSLLGLVGVVTALLILSPLLLAVSMLGFVPLWLATTRISRIVFEFMLEMTPNDRKRGYVLGLLTSRDMAKEVRAFGLGSYLRDVYERLSEDRIVRLRQHLRQRAGLSFIGSAASAPASGVTAAVLVWLITTGPSGLAAAGAAAMASFQLGAQLQGITFSGGQLYESALFIEDLGAFLDLLPAIMAARPATPAPRGFKKIEVREAHFTYPTTPPPAAESAAAAPRRRAPPPFAARRMGFGAGPMMFFGSRPSGADGDGHRRPHALKGVSIELNQGEVVALVGENGSGKTTLAQLICGLYTPDEGALVWAGIHVSAVDRSPRREQLPVLFQDFVRYWLTARENIGISRTERMGDQEAIAAAARQAGADQFIGEW